MEATVDYYETEHYLFVHGWFPDPPLTLRSANKEEWIEARRTKWNQRYTGQRPLAEKTVVCGHVPSFNAHAFDSERDRSDNSIFYGNGLVVLDGGVADTKHINVLVIEGE